MDSQNQQQTEKGEHYGWVRICHWVVTISFLLLAFTGIEILMVNPQLFWGEVGNGLTPPLLEIPIGPNYQQAKWEKRISFFDSEGSPITAIRSFEDMFNKNSWGRSLHFLAAWFLVVAGIIYLVLGIISGHFRYYLWPKRKELFSKIFWKDVMNHLRMKIPTATAGPKYGILQKLAYLSVIFIMMPIMVVTGLTMSPAITASYPFLLDLFGGYQSARTIHFFISIALELFLFVHLVMIIKSGFLQQIRYMTYGK